MAPLDTLAFHCPLGDAVLLDLPASLHFNDGMCAMFAGGPSGWVEGRVVVTLASLASRPVVGQPHPQQLTVDRTSLGPPRLVQRRWLGLFSRGAPEVHLTLSAYGRDFELRFRMSAPEVLVEVLSQPPVPVSTPPVELLSQAMDLGVSEPGRYVPALAALSFPQGFWHTESMEDCVDIARTTLADLGAVLPEGFLGGLDLDVETLWGPEDYETGPGSESWGRREQIDRICVAANGVLEGDRRFYAFEEDLPDWEFGEPVWLFLTEAERQRLVALGILRSRMDSGQTSG